MKNICRAIVILLLSAGGLRAETGTLRLDLYHTGTKGEEVFAVNLVAHVDQHALDNALPNMWVVPRCGLCPNAGRRRERLSDASNPGQACPGGPCVKVYRAPGCVFEKYAASQRAVQG